MQIMMRLKQADALRPLTNLFREISQRIKTASIIGDLVKDAITTKQTTSRQNPGQVFLVGAGVGDIDLLTLKAIKAIQAAEVILIDALVDKDIYQFFPEDAKCVYVGKKCGQHSMPQQQICTLLLEYALQGKTVVRLKGGDPSIFGRLGEETAILQQHNINFAVIPGITAATGCAAYSGIPLTHRDCAQSVRFVTASLKDKDDEANWQLLAHEKDTLVFYMGLGKVALISKQLCRHGMRKTMPIAIIDQGTLAEQQVVCSTLEHIEKDMQEYCLKGPAVIIVGEVVNKRAKIHLPMLQKAHNQQPIHT